MFGRKIMEKSVEIYLFLFATVHLLYFGFSGYAHIFDAKVVTFCTFNIFLFLCAGISLVFIFEEKDLHLRSKLKRNIKLPQIFVLLYMLFTLVSGLASSHFPDTVSGVSRFEGMLTISIYCLSFLLISLFPCRKKYLFVAFAIAVTLFSVICVIQLFGYNPFSLYPDGMNFYDAGVLYTTAFIGTTGNTNLSGAFISLALPFLTVILLEGKGKKHILLIVPVVLLIFVVLKMDVTSTLLGLAVAVLIILPRLLKLSCKQTLLFFACIVILAIAFIFFIYYNPPENIFLSEISEILHGNFSDSFGSGRIRIWKNVVSELGDNPILGKGPDTMQKEGFPAFERYYPALGKVKRTSIDVAHNELLNILYHQGILGLFAYLGFVIFTLHAWLKNKADPVIFALGVSFVCYLVQSLFTFSMCVSAPYFWICAGLVHGFVNRKNTLNQ